MLVLIIASIVKWALYTYIIRHVWNNVLVKLFHENLRPIGLVSAGFLLLLFRILLGNHVYIRYRVTNALTPCEQACTDACVGL